MKYFLIAVIIIGCLSCPVKAQIHIKLDIKGNAVKKLSKEMNEGDSFKAVIFTLEDNNIENVFTPAIYVEKDSGDDINIGSKQKVIDDLTFKYTAENYWKITAIKNGIYMNLLDDGYQYSLRNDLEEECLEYLNYLAGENLLYEDVAIKDYLQSLFLKIMPNPLGDGRIGQIDIRILKINEPYAAILANGTALISVGIINLVENEEELLAVLAHETAHFVLDHSVQSINSDLARQKRAEFWAGLVTVAAAATTVYAAAKNDVYIDPSFTVSTAALSYGIAANINKRVGLKYSREQELIADQCSSELLNLLGCNPQALSVVLMKLRDYYLQTGNYKVFSNDGTHPNINYRIEQIGIPAESKPDLRYESRISNLLAIGAREEYSQSHFQVSEEILNRILTSGAAVEEDYILLALVYLAQYNSPSKYEDALSFLDKAKEIDVSFDYQVYKVEALVFLRQNNTSRALNSLNNYLTGLLNDFDNFNQNLLVSPYWNSIYSRLNQDIEWTKRLIYRLKRRS